MNLRNCSSSGVFADPSCGCDAILGGDSEVNISTSAEGQKGSSADWSPIGAGVVRERTALSLKIVRLDF